MSDDDAQLLEHGLAFAVAITAALPAWVERCVAQRCDEAGVPEDDQLRAAARRAGAECATEVGRTVTELLTTDPDGQESTPLTLLRKAVAYPTGVLAAAGVPPVERDDFSRRSFPEDPYDLSPATVADVDPSLHDLAMTWGAARAWVHRRRHGGGV